MHVVIVDEELPYPPNSGKRIRTLNLTLRLARKHRLTYIAHRHAENSETAAAEAYFHTQGIETQLADRQVPPKSGLGFYFRLVWNLFSRLPYSVQTHASKALQLLIQKYHSDNNVDLWHCEWTPYAENLRKALPEQPFIEVAHNIESQIWERYAEHEANPLKRWFIRQQCSKFKRFERDAFAAANTTITVSQTDADLARSSFGAKDVDVVENGVDLTYFHRADLPREAGTILFLGSLDWRPNLDAVTLLLNEIFPRVLRHEPAAKLWLVGRNPPAWLADRVRKEKNVEIHEDVPDVRPFLWRCSVMTVPLRIGGGSRLKILEALACNCPVVSTSVGAEGLELVPGKHYLQANTPAEMAQLLRKCLSLPAAVAAMTQCGHEVVRQTYSWDILSKKLEEIWCQQAAPNREVRRMKIVQLTSSRFFGGPERQMLELAESLQPRVDTTFISFSEGGLCRNFLDAAQKKGFEALELANDTPRLFSAAAELKKLLQNREVDLLLCQGYKADLLGLWVARRLGIPVAATSRGWTGENAKVRFYETLDRRALRWMDHIVCVSEGQAQKVRTAGVGTEKISVIHNSIRTERFAENDDTYGKRLRAFFPNPPRRIIGAAGRLSPEKGFDILIDAAAQVCQNQSGVGFVLFGDGPLRSALSIQIEKRGLQGRFLLSGFTDALDRYLPHFDIFAQSSYTEGLPNVILESFAAGIPVVATAVGGTPELVIHGENGFLVPPGDPAALARHLCELLDSPARRETMGIAGRKRVELHFSFDAQAEKYKSLFGHALGCEIPSDNTPIDKELAPAL